ncbi:GNAT family N-acetyltransferase [Peribacillus loiseleuriae]|uniref:GNAT family N-acetyltransferase n=1 Tax=Peribacillus loiseleuriae TaxID=1679170 RepID=UPI003D03B816
MNKKESKMKTLYEVPDSKEYIDLRLAAGLDQKEELVVKTALSHTIFSVIIRGDASELIGMGRIIGDGGCFFQIVDLIVRPSHQDQEIDDMILYEILGYLGKNAPKDADVIAMADLSHVKFYQKYDFKLVYPDSYGMSKKL